METLKNKYIGLACAVLALLLSACAPVVPPKVYESPPPAIPSADGDLFNRALKAQNAGQLDNAEKYWMLFLEKHPSSYEAHNNLGEVYYLEDKLSQALREFETAYRLEPISDKIRDNYERVLKFQLTLLNESRDYHRVIEGLKRLKEIVPPSEKEGVQFKIERIEDKIYQDVQRADTVQGYKDFLSRYPNGVNAESAQRRLRTLQEKGQMSGGLSSLDGTEKIPQVRGYLKDPVPADNIAPIREQDFLEVAVEEKSAGDAIESFPLTESEGPEAAGSAGTTAGPTLAPRAAEPPAAMTEPSVKQPEVASLEPQTGPEAALPEVQEMPPVFGQPDNAQAMSPPALETPFEPVKEFTGTMEPPAEMAEPDFAALEPLGDPDEYFPESTGSADPVEPPFSGLEPAALAAPVQVAADVDQGSHLNVRAAPSASGELIGKLTHGETRPFVGEVEGWFQIDFHDGQTGWVSNRYSHKVEGRPGPALAGGEQMSHLSAHTRP